MPDLSRQWPSRRKLQGAVGLCTLVAASVMGSLQNGAARALVAAILVAANAFALTACLLRARRFPGEAPAWRTLASGLGASILANAALSLPRGAGSGQLALDALSILAVAYATVVYPWGLLRLPMAFRHPEAFRIQVLGALVFGSSLALFLWLLGMWQAAAGLTVLDRAILATFCCRFALMGGVVAYQLVDDPGRLQGPLAWVLVGTLGGSVPGIWLISHPAAALGLAYPLAAFVPVFAWSIGFAALDPLPADGPEGEGRAFRSVPLEALLYLPYFASALCLLIAAQASARHLLVPMLGFIAVSTLLVVHQFALLREVRVARDLLDRRVQDRTRALEEAQGVLLQTERMNTLGMLGAGMAHDLNNALAGIVSSLDLIRLKLEEGRPPTDPDLERIAKAAWHCAGMGQRLMGFAREGTETPRDLDVGVVVEEERALLRMVLPSRIRLDLAVAPGAYPVRAVRGQVQQVLVNLVGNAKDAIAGAGAVSVRVSPGALAGGGACALLEVADSGSGMPPEVLERLFEPLFTTKPPGKGTGLGLASVQAILKGLDGEIAVTSAPGSGTTFALRIPLRG